MYVCTHLIAKKNLKAKLPVDYILKLIVTKQCTVGFNCIRSVWRTMLNDMILITGGLNIIPSYFLATHIQCVYMHLSTNIRV